MSALSAFSDPDEREDRIQRVARALCRAARLDPDAPAPAPAYTMMIQHNGTARRPANWTAFRWRAEKLIVDHAEQAEAL